MENLEYVIKKKNGEIISINVEEIESMYYRNVENGTDSLLDPNVEEGSTYPLKFKIISNTEAAVVYDELYKDLNSFVIPPKIRIRGRIYDVRMIDRAFKDCTILTSIDIPNSVNSIVNDAFCRCSGLTSIEIPNSVTKIGVEAFHGCTGLTSIVIPDSVTEIGKDAFHDCTGLTSIEIPDSVTEIGKNAFHGCTGLTSIEIPNSVTSIGDDAFSSCPKLESIDVDSNNPNYSSEDGVLYNKDKSTLIKVPEGKKGIYEIPYSVKEIKNDACKYIKHITKIVIYPGVKEIKDNTFDNCSSLTDIIIPSSVVRIGYRAFFNCTSLTNIALPASITEIKEQAFFCCTSLTNITIPASVTYIGEFAFGNCTNLDVYIENAKDDVKIEETAFANCNKSVKFLH